jgi:hypothetical protein
VRLTDLERSGRGTALRYQSAINDDLGAADYELSISGPPALIAKVLAKSEFEILISPRAGEKDAQARALEMWHQHADAAPGSGEAPDIKRLFKKTPAAATPANSILVSLRRTRGAGTFWAGWFPTLFVPAGASLFFALPPVCTAFGTLFPISGDPDLFLRLNGPTAPIVAGSAGAGLARDTVSFGPWVCWPWTQFVPFYQVLGFLTSVTDIFIGGHGVP